MDLRFSGEQSLLAETMRRLMRERYRFDQRAAYLGEADGWSRALWAHYADLGLLGMAFDPEHGGVGAGAVETMIVMEAFGRSLALEPYLPGIVLCGGLLKRAGSVEQRDRLLPRVAEGSLLLAFAQGEIQSRYDLADVTTTARPVSGGWQIDGEKLGVLQGDCADAFIVSARIAGSRRDRAGLGLFLVEANAPGVSRRNGRAQDGRGIATVSFSKARVGEETVIGVPGDALPLIEHAVDEGIVAVCAEAVGVLSSLLDLTVEHLKSRRQFGVTLASFQVLQHRAAEMLIALEQARSMALFAALMVGDADPEERGRAVAAAKIEIGHAARFIGQQAVQLHGGTGLAAGSPVGDFFRRATMIGTLLGDADHHLGRLAIMAD